MRDRNDEEKDHAPAPRRRDAADVEVDPFVPSLDAWAWLKELRFRFECALEIFNQDLAFVLPSASRLGRGDDIRDAFRRDPGVREAVGQTLRTGKPRSVSADGLQIRLIPLFRRAAFSRAIIGCLALADRSPASEPGAGASRETERRLDLASQWLVPAIEATIDAAAASVTDIHTTQRLASMVEVVHALNDLDNDRAIVQLLMDAVALWFDADVRIYRQNLQGILTVDAWLPAASRDDRPTQLPDDPIWLDEEIIPGEHLQNVPGFAWDPRLGGVLLAPIQIDGATEWLLMASGSSDAAIRSILAFLCRGASLCLTSRAFAAQERLRRRVDTMLTAGDPPFEETVRLTLEASGREVSATAARLALYLSGGTPASTIGWGRSEHEGPTFVEPGTTTATAQEIAIGVKVRAELTAVLELSRLEGEFTPADVRLATAAAGQLADWLAGAFASRSDVTTVLPGAAEQPPHAPPPSTAAQLKGVAVVAVLIDAPAVNLTALAREIERHLRASEVVIELPRRGAAALLQRTADLAVVRAIAGRLQLAARERFRAPVRIGVATSTSPSDLPQAVIERAIAGAERGDAT